MKDVKNYLEKKTKNFFKREEKLKDEFMQETSNLIASHKDFFDKKDWGYLASLQDDLGNFFLITNIEKSSDNNNGYHVVRLTTDDNEKLILSELSLTNCISLFNQLYDMVNE